jgi:hypothetical protein
MADYCTICWKHLGLVGPRHLCVPRAKPDWLIAVEAKAAVVTNSKPPSVNSQASVPVGVNKSRHGKHRDPEAHRVHMREHMRKKRAGGSP